MTSPIRVIVDRILAPDCPPNIVGGPGYFPYQTGNLSGPMYPMWGSNPCQMQKLQEIMSMLNRILLPLSREQQLIALNQPVVTFVPGQGNTEITLLESAIVMRWPGLVSQLLIFGANPNVTTSGIPLVAQLLQAIPLSPCQNTQVIIDLLLQSGALVPPGFPGTQGYLIPGSLRRRHLF